MTAENQKIEECHLILLTEGMQDKQLETTMEHFAEGVIILNTTWTAETTNRNIIIKNAWNPAADETTTIQHRQERHHNRNRNKNNLNHQKTKINQQYLKFINHL